MCGYEIHHHEINESRPLFKKEGKNNEMRKRVPVNDIESENTTCGYERMWKRFDLESKDIFVRPSFCHIM